MTNTTPILMLLVVVLFMGVLLLFSLLHMLLNFIGGQLKIL